MPLLSNGASLLLGGGRPWQTGNGTIPLANVIDARKLPAQGERITPDPSLADAWTIALRTNITSVTSHIYTFDSNTGRTVFGVARVLGPAQNGFYVSDTWCDVTLWVTGDHTYMLISDGNNVQAYRDNIAIGAAVASGNNIGGQTRWRSDPPGTNNLWPFALPGAALYNIALDVTQRAALHTALMALPAS